MRENPVLTHASGRCVLGEVPRDPVHPDVDRPGIPRIAGRGGRRGLILAHDVEPLACLHPPASGLPIRSTAEPGARVEGVRREPIAAALRIDAVVHPCFPLTSRGVARALTHPVDVAVRCAAELEHVWADPTLPGQLLAGRNRKGRSRRNAYVLPDAVEISRPITIREHGHSGLTAPVGPSMSVSAQVSFGAGSVQRPVSGRPAAQHEPVVRTHPDQAPRRCGGACRPGVAPRTRRERL